MDLPADMNILPMFNVPYIFEYYPPESSLSIHQIEGWVFLQWEGLVYDMEADYP